jgi:hypothetical protein
MNKPGKGSVFTAGCAALPLFLILSVFATWPLSISPHPHDHADTLFNCWLMEWNIHALQKGANPLQQPIFSGFPDAGGRSDLLLTQAVIGMPFRVLGLGAVRTHNLLLVLFLALTGFSAALLASEFKADTWGSLYAGCAVILLDYFQSHMWHIQLFSPGLAILGTVFGLRTLKGKARGWQVGLFVILQCGASLYHWYFMNLALLLLIPVSLRREYRKHALKLASWWLAGNLACLPLLTEHLRNSGRWAMDTITSTDVSAFVSPWSSSILLGWLRSPHAHPEAALWPGAGILAGAVWFLLRGKRKPFDGYLAACTAFFLVFSLGPTLSIGGSGVAPAPLRLLAGLPGILSIRLPARAAVFALVPMAVFAGRMFGRKPVLASVAVLVSAAGILHPPLETIPVGVTPVHQWLRESGFKRVLFLPISDSMERPETETLRMYGSISHFTPSVNGYSTSLPRDYSRVASVLNTWPSPSALALAGSLSVDCIVVEGVFHQEADTVFAQNGRHFSAVVIQ